MTDFEQLQIIVAFLQETGPDTFARSLEPLAPELEARLVRLANGELEATEARKLLAEISQQGAAIARLAELLRDPVDGESET